MIKSFKTICEGWTFCDGQTERTEQQSDQQELVDASKTFKTPLKCLKCLKYNFVADAGTNQWTDGPINQKLAYRIALHATKSSEARRKTL